MLSPTDQDLRAGRYPKTNTSHPGVLATCAALGAPPETGGGVTLLPSETVEACLTDRRRAELVQPFRLVLLKLSSQESARLMATGDYDAALPIALDAVRQGQDLFKPSPALQLFPLYLLAAQANLGLKRAKPCEDFLGLASWLALKDTESTTNVMRSQLARLFGQLRAVQGEHHEALKSFAEDVYHCSMEYGPEDVRTSLGYYNLSKVFQGVGDIERSLSCNIAVVDIWMEAMVSTVLCTALSTGLKKVKKSSPVGGQLPLGRSQLLEVVDMLEDIRSLRVEALGPRHPSVGDCALVASLALARVGGAGARARGEALAAAALAAYPEEEEERVHLAREALARVTAAE